MKFYFKRCIFHQEKQQTLLADLGAYPTFSESCTNATWHRRLVWQGLKHATRKGLDEEQVRAEGVKGEQVSAEGVRGRTGLEQKELEGEQV